MESEIPRCSCNTGSPCHIKFIQEYKPEQYDLRPDSIYWYKVMENNAWNLCREYCLKRKHKEIKEPSMSDEQTVFACPSCGSENVAVTEETMFLVNTMEHWCHSVKAHDDDAKATCLHCQWTGKRHQFKTHARKARKGRK